VGEVLAYAAAVRQHIGQRRADITEAGIKSELGVDAVRQVDDGFVKCTAGQK
jgi:hypothetical protein